MCVGSEETRGSFDVEGAGKEGFGADDEAASNGEDGGDDLRFCAGGGGDKWEEGFVGEAEGCSPSSIAASSS